MRIEVEFKGNAIRTYSSIRTKCEPWSFEMKFFVGSRRKVRTIRTEFFEEAQISRESAKLGLFRQLFGS